MELTHLHGILYSSIGHVNHANLIEYYKCFTKRDISNLKVGMVEESIDQINHVLEHPEIDLQQYCSTPYSNEELRSWLPIYKEHLEFTLESYEKENFILTHEDVKVWLEQNRNS